ncbi:MAG: hydrogenase [Planctomycetes bacterium]|nr:hydrogenase [Planctomycetota bacterium]
MTDALNAILVIVLVMNLFVLGTSRILAVINTVATQGALLGVIPLLVHTHLTISVVLTSVAAIVLKGVVIPSIMIRALRDAEIKREVEPLIGLLPSIMLGALATAFALLFAGELPLAGEHQSALLVPTSIASVLVGFIILTSRFKALSQVIGYLVLENGIFIFGMLLIDAMPLLVEMGVLLDLFVGIFVICIIVNHINRAFSSLDTRLLASLKE